MLFQAFFCALPAFREYRRGAGSKIIREQKNTKGDKFMKLGVAGVRLDVVDEITDRFVKKIENRVHKYGNLVC